MLDLQYLTDIKEIDIIILSYIEDDNILKEFCNLNNYLLKLYNEDELWRLKIYNEYENFPIPNNVDPQKLYFEFDIKNCDDSNIIQCAIDNNCLDILLYFDVPTTNIYCYGYINAFAKGYLDIVKYYVEKSKDINCCIYREEIAKYGHIDILHYLISLHSDNKYPVTSDDFIAARYGHLDYLKKLSTHGYDYSRYSSRIWTSSHCKMV